MFDLEMSQEVLEYAWQLRKQMLSHDRIYLDGNASQQLIGLAGQTLVHDLFGVERPRDLGRPDGGVDFRHLGLSVDVKTMQREKRPSKGSSNNYPARQMHFPTDLLLFTSFARSLSKLTVCGWITKQEFGKAAKLQTTGTEIKRGDGNSFSLREDTYTIENWKLHSPDTAEQLHDQLARLSKTFRPTPVVNADFAPHHCCGLQSGLPGGSVVVH